jgi:hypothetical protein
VPHGVEVSDDALVEAVEEAVQDGATDPWEGGVPDEEVAARTALAQRTARERLSTLADAGRLRQVWGLTPETQEPRVSYLPADAGETGDS